MTITTTEEHNALREEQVRQAEQLLFSGPKSVSFAKQLFQGYFAGELISPYPQLAAEQQQQVATSLAEVKAYCDQHLDPEAIDRQADIPRDVIEGLGRLGVLGMTAPTAVGGRGFSQLAYCKVLEEIGSRCSATSIFVNAHHSIGMRGLLLFGTDEQKERWLPDLVSGKKLAAFALTETQAGSDAANVQTRATLSENGKHFTLNGDKRYITNGAIADVLTVMARTPVAGRDETAVTAFLVTPDMPGFRVVEPRMEKLGIRGTATAKLAFENMQVPAGNILGPPGKGLRVALTVLDFGRTTFGACCTGAAKTCLRLATEHARTRIQFGQPLAEFELVQKKLARMAAWTYAMEAMTSVTAGLIDRGLEDYMVETAMLKVYTTEVLWEIVNDAFQIHGGAAYFTDRPLARMLRDARINQIGEGANEVLTSFIGLVGLRDPGERLKSVGEALQQPLRGVGTLARFAAGEITRRITLPPVSVQSPTLQPHARRLARLVRRFALQAQRQLIRHREKILDRQLVQQRIANAAMELYASTCVLSRRDAELQSADRDRVTSQADVVELFLRHSSRRIDDNLRALTENDDAHLVAAARDALSSAGTRTR
ncbi:MAG: acyl-CoA dehydrogenase family protein [Planctomycetota bacterium]|nr:acyl-CoA dehydrogenase family protein [Planctomycetota bacterium]